MKHEWRKHEKKIYLPKQKPVVVEAPAFKYFTIGGEGNPNSELFTDRVEILYALSYAVKMSPKKNMAPDGYFDYTVYPLEGIWDVNDEAKKKSDKQLDKNSLVYKIMIRQPEFVDDNFAQRIIEIVKEKKPYLDLSQVKFEQIEEGKCVQMLHVGSYDDEPASFEQMKAFAEQNGFRRLSKNHKEIYLTDARKVAPEKLKTVLRFEVE
ncbi:MAG: GyrI-like domain-containing protein [Salinivirgaceae bacterium]|jgi:hypothetical protein|nr:GyrI-like domain-containing protein [Salinivirgaceae bacterium]